LRILFLLAAWATILPVSVWNSVASAMNGPPLIIYGALRGWSPQHLRATLQGYFLPASLVGMYGYWLKGLWTPAVTHTYLVALPPVMMAIYLGRAVNNRMNGRLFLIPNPRQRTFFGNCST